MRFWTFLLIATLWSCSSKPDPVPEPPKKSAPSTLPVQGAPGLVVSPYAKEGPYIDVSGLTPGTQIVCPKTGATLTYPGPKAPQ